MPLIVPSPSKKGSRGSAEPPEVHVLLIEAFDERRGAYQRRLDRCIKTRAEADIHDLRIAVRRFIAALDLFAAVLPHRHVHKVERSLRDQLKCLSPLRDVQVEIHFMDKLRKKHSALFAFHAVLRVREKKIVKDIMKYLRRHSHRFDEELSAIREQFVSAVANPALLRPVSSAAIGSLASEYLTVVALRKELSADDMETLHKMRVAFKQFRYRMEIVQTAHVYGMTSLFRRMHLFQDRMGTIHDYEILLASLEDFQKTCGNRARNDLQMFSEELKRNHDTLVGAFLETADEIYTFWKVKPA